MREGRVLLLLTLLFSGPLLFGQAEYLGSETCGVCHEDIHQAFQKNPHWVIETSPSRGFEGRTCEACHGPGSQHMEKMDAASIRNPARLEPAHTSDGREVEVAANVNRVADATRAVEMGADGVGLMRTEFLFLERESAPSEEGQYQAYRAMVEAMEGRPLIIRTLDIGGDKEVPYLNLPKEDNSFLGIRGIRLCLARPDLFVPQLRAIYRAAAFGPMLPRIRMKAEATAHLSAALRNRSRKNEGIRWNGAGRRRLPERTD